MCYMGLMTCNVKALLSMGKQGTKSFAHDFLVPWGTRVTSVMAAAEAAAEAVAERKEGWKEGRVVEGRKEGLPFLRSSSIFEVIIFEVIFHFWGCLPKSQNVKEGRKECLPFFEVVFHFCGHLPFLRSSSIFEVVFQKVKISMMEGLPILRLSSIFEVIFHFWCCLPFWGHLPFFEVRGNLKYEWFEHLS